MTEEITHVCVLNVAFKDGIKMHFAELSTVNGHVTAPTKLINT